MAARPSVALSLHRTEVRRIAESRSVRNPRVFGSAARGDDTETSDLDLLVDVTDRTSLFDLAAIELDLEALLGVRVQVTTADGLPDRLRTRILAEARALGSKPNQD